MNAPTTPIDALHLLAGLIATDIRAGSPVISVPSASPEPPPCRRGRPRSRPYAVVATPLARAA